MDYKEYTILGKNKGPKVAFVGSQHGDEPIGKLVIEKLLDLKIKNGTLSLIVANPKALKQKKRFLESDLNRSYIGKVDGTLEERIAFSLLNKLKNYDYVFDIHSASMDCGDIIIVTKVNDQTKKMISLLPVKRILHITNKVYGKTSLISHCNGVALEYGPNKSGKNYKRALNHVKIILKNLKMIPNKKLKNGKYNIKREMYTATQKYIFKKPLTKIEKNLREFKFITKGQLIGERGKEKVSSQYSFYPVFTQKKNSKNFSLMTTKKIINI